jgi:hypothetical protein
MLFESLDEFPTQSECGPVSELWRHIRHSQTNFENFLSFRNHKMNIGALYPLVQLGDRISSPKSEETLILFLKTFYRRLAFICLSVEDVHRARLKELAKSSLIRCLRKTKSRHVIKTQVDKATETRPNAPLIGLSPGTSKCEAIKKQRIDKAEGRYKGVAF